MPPLNPAWALNVRDLSSALHQRPPVAADGRMFVISAAASRPMASPARTATRLIEIKSVSGRRGARGWARCRIRRLGRNRFRPYVLAEIARNHDALAFGQCRTLGLLIDLGHHPGRHMVRRRK